MAGINGEDDMLSNARNAGSRPLRGEKDLSDRGLLSGGCFQRGGGEKLSMDLDRVGLRGTVGLSG